mmetsp:Transcript_100465/g.284551  ORF Transcript_100465/g.284551 Transcript_100465/m.284551 type:complete len:114 (-) Transcript_100465:57-398(-)
MTTLDRATARFGPLGRAAARAAAAPATVPGPLVRGLATTSLRLGKDYDWNLGVPGSRVRNPAPEQYNDVYPGMGRGWWTLILLSTACWFWGNCYDTSRGVNIAIGLFGPNMPM